MTMQRLRERLPFSRRETVRLAIPLLALVLVASVVTGRETPVVAPEPASHLQKRILSEKAVSDADLDLERLKRPAREEDKVAAAADPFARRSFGAAPEGAAGAEAPAQAAAPQVPELPFTYLGKVIEDGKLSVFLGRGEDSYSLQAGKRHKLDSEYRVDKVTESAVVFTYLPMNARQTLDIPAVTQ